MKLCMWNNIACKDKDFPILIKILSKSFVRILQDPQEQTRSLLRSSRNKFLIGVLQRSLSTSCNSSHGFAPMSKRPSLKSMWKHCVKLRFHNPTHMFLLPSCLLPQTSMDDTTLSHSSDVTNRFYTIKSIFQ